MAIDQNPPRQKPQFKRLDENDMIPVGLVRAMGALALASLALVSFSVFTDRAVVGVPEVAPVVEEWRISLVAGDDQAASVFDEDGALIVDLDHGGFVTVVQNGLATMRRRHGIDPDLPLRIVRFENGRLAAIDPLTSFDVELTGFGPDNLAAFEALLEGQPPHSAHLTEGE